MFRNCLCGPCRARGAQSLEGSLCPQLRLHGKPAAVSQLMEHGGGRGQVSRQRAEEVESLVLVRGLPSGGTFGLRTYASETTGKERISQ